MTVFEPQSVYYSPAKINLFLRILSKRADGFHDIFFVLQSISLFDVLHVSKADEDKFICSDSSLQNSSNLVIKALNLFRDYTGIDEAIAIRLKKNIPIESGLGGGSSNAATLLWALNDIFKAHLSKEEMMSLAEKLGSDVSFFFSKGRALCLGRGEIIKDLLPVKRSFSFWIAKPNFGMSTKEVYRKYDDIGSDVGCINDLEKSAFFVEPRLIEVKRRLLSNGFRRVVMTGSGSGFYCFGEPLCKDLEGIMLYPVNNLYRSSESWYQTDVIQNP